MSSLPDSELTSRSLASRSRLGNALLVLGCLLAVGTIGFYLLEGWSLAESLYTAVIIITTIGYGQVRPLTTPGLLFTILYMLVSVGAAAYALSSTIQSLVSSELINQFGARRRHRELEKLQNHFIICGAGRVGRRIIRDLEREALPFVVIESNPARVAPLTERGVRVVAGDATLEATLREAGVIRARGLAACLQADADNLYVVLTARDLNRELYIVVRAIEEQAEPKLVRAGANRVVAPTIIGSHRMAQALVKPAVADFIDSIAAENLDLGFEEVEISLTSPYANQPLKLTNIRAQLNIVIVAIRQRSGEMIFNPSGETVLQPGDLLVAIGQAESLAELKRQASGAHAAAKLKTRA